MPADFTRRFDSKGEVYAKFRPTYPKRILDILTREISFNRNMVVADVGSGTGILSKLFLERGNTVYGVEPNNEMRSYADESLATYPNFYSVVGRAEETNLRAKSVDLVAVGQALHWFDPERATREFARISKNNGGLCVVYNDRNREDAFMKAYDVLIEKHGQERRKDKWRSEKWFDEHLSKFYRDGKYGKFTLKNEQELDHEGLLGRITSASYIPNLDESEKSTLVNDVSTLFREWEKEGKVRMLYDSLVYVGRIR